MANYSQTQVVTHLILNPDATAQEIVDGTNLSRATVHRVIKDLTTEKVIEATRINAKRTTYSVNAEAIKDWEEYFPKPKPVGKARKDRNKDKVEQLLSLSITNQVEQITLGANTLPTAIRELVRAEHISHLLQSGQGTSDVVQWSKTIENLRKVQVFAQVLNSWCEFYLDHPQANTPDYWAIFPKEQ